MAQTYDGHIPRQALVDFCKSKVSVISAEFDREQTLLGKGDTLSDEQYETLMLSCSALAGGVSAFREITEWARKHVEEQRRASL